MNIGLFKFVKTVSYFIIHIWQNVDPKYDYLIP